MDSAIWQWQASTSSSRERLAYLLETGFRSDLTIETAWKVFKVHKLILAMSSSVFFEMMYDSRYIGQKKLYVNDVPPHIFSKLLFYIYKDETNFSSINEAVQLRSAAIKYQMIHLKGLCLQYLRESITVQSVSTIWRTAVENDINELSEECLQYVIQNTEDCLVDEYIGILPDLCVRYILEQPILKAKEITLFHFLWKWTSFKVNNDFSNITLEHLRETMQPFINLIHFHEMSKENILKSVIPKNIHTPEEILKIKNDNPEFNLPVVLFPKCRGEQSRYSFDLINVLYIFSRAADMCYSDLTSFCLQYIAEHANKVLAQSDFLNLSDCKITAIIDQSELRATEAEIFSALYSWAHHRASKESNKSPTMDEILQELKPFLVFVRFSEMQQSEFYKLVRPTGLFSENEFHALQQTRIHSFQVAEYPPKYRNEVPVICERNFGISIWTSAAEILSFHSLIFRINHPSRCCFCGFRLTNQVVWHDGAPLTGKVFSVEGTLMEGNNYSVMVNFCVELAQPYDVTFCKRVILEEGRMYKLSFTLKAVGESEEFYVETSCCRKVAEDIAMTVEFMDDPESKFTSSANGLIYHLYFWN